MKSRRLRNGWRALALVSLWGSYCLNGTAAPPVRITRNIEGSGTFTLRGNVHRIPTQAQDLGQADPSLTLPRITLHFAMTSAQQAELQSLLEAQQTRGNSQYHKWLTPEEFADRFGVSQRDVEKVTEWLESRGFWGIETARSRTFISFSGTAAQAEAAFGTSLHRFNVNGEVHYANLTDPVLPGALQGVVASIHGLNDFHPKPRLIAHAALHPHFTSSITGNTFLSPGDFATIYDVNPLYNSGLDGSGRNIVVAGQSDIQLSDIEIFRNAAGLAPNDPEVVLVPVGPGSNPDPGTNAADQSESELDLEWAGAIAKNAHMIYVNSHDVFTSVTYAIDNNLAGVLLVTYGACESSLGNNTVNSINNTLAQANAQGITVIAASGDDGAADCDEGTASTPPSIAKQGLAVDFPASSPYVTGIGGTEFNEGSGTYWQKAMTADIISSAISYIPEIAWNDTSQNGYLSASGGGASILFSKPLWQTGNGVPNDGARDVPDVALSASPDHDGYLVCSGDGATGNPSMPDCTSGFRAANSDLDVVGGTSAAVPGFAGIIALLNQQTNERQGNINTNLYALASVSTDAFHDITQGSNMVPCQQGTPDCPVSGQMGYLAGPGYDQVTGLGSIDAYNLIREWNANFSIAISPATLTVNPGSSATATVTITPTGTFNGTVSFSCSVGSGLANVTCSIPGTVLGTGTATLTITAASNAFLPPANLHWPSRMLPVVTILGGIGILLWARKRTRWALASLAFVSLGLVSCGGGGTGTSGSTSMALQSVAESGTVTVTATSGVISHTATVSVTVP
jgi:subtilase family serine protease